MFKKKKKEVKTRNLYGIVAGTNCIRRRNIIVRKQVKKKKIWHLVSNSANSLIWQRCDEWIRSLMRSSRYVCFINCLRQSHNFSHIDGNIKLLSASILHTMDLVGLGPRATQREPRSHCFFQLRPFWIIMQA